MPHSPARSAVDTPHAPHRSRILMQAGGRERPLSFGGVADADPLLASAATPWSGLPFELHHMRPFEGDMVVGPRTRELGMLVILDGAIEIVSRDGLHQRTSTATTGSIAILSGDHARACVRVRGSAATAALDIPQAWLDRLDGAACTQVLRTGFVRDDAALSMARAIRAEVACGASTGPFFAESLSLALLSHVTDRYGARAPRVRGQLTSAQCDRLRSYIRESLDAELSLSSLAALVGVSPRHFVTLFRRAFGTSPHRYVLEQRLAEGARLLESGGAHDLAEIALRVGFSSQSHFTTAFRRAHGPTPARFARGLITARR